MRKSVKYLLCAMLMLIPSVLWATESQTSEQNEDFVVENQNICNPELNVLSENASALDIGDHFTVTTTVVFDSSCALNAEPAPTSAALSCTVEPRAQHIDGQRTTETLTLACTVLKPGYHLLQPFRMTLNSADDGNGSIAVHLKTPPVWIHAPIRPYEQNDNLWLPMRYHHWLVSIRMAETSLILLIIALYVAIFKFFYVRLFLPELDSHADAVQPFEIYIREKLSELIEYNCTTQEDYRNFYDDLSHLIRWYITLQCEFEEEECNTSQFTDKLSELPFSPELIRRIHSLLQFADAARFSGNSASNAQNIDAIQKACAIIDDFDKERINIRSQILRIVT